MSNKIKVLFCSDLVVETGFSRVSHSIIKYLPRDKFEIVGLGVNYFGDPHKYDFDIYPTILPGGRRDLYGFERLKSILDKYKPDIIFILNDVWILDQYLQVLKEYYKDSKNLLRPKIVVYFPVDAEDHDPEWYKHFDIVTRAVVYTKFGSKIVSEAAPFLKTKIIPHGIDAEVFYKLPLSKLEIRKKIFVGKEDLWDKFIVFNGNRNQPRKRLDLTLKAFQIFANNKPDARLYIHAGVVDCHINIAKLAQRFNIDDKLILTNLNKGPQQVPLETLNWIYNTTDIGTNSSVGEGWGLVNMEHAVTGSPQVVPAHSANAEVYNGCGVLINKGTPFILESMTTGYMASPRDIANGFEKLYRDKELYNKLSEKSIEKFTSDKYSWKEIAKQWSSLFEEILE